MIDADSKKREKKLEPGKETQVSFLTDGIETRISESAKLLGTRKNAAEAMGVSVDSLQRYMRGEIKPPVDAVARLAQAAGVSIEWLTVGRGEVRPQGGDQEAAQKPAKAPLYIYKEGFSPEYIEGVILLVERHKGTQGMPPAEKARFIRELLEHQQEKDEQARQLAQEMLKQGPPQPED